MYNCLASHHLCGSLWMTTIVRHIQKWIFMWMAISSFVLKSLSQPSHLNSLKPECLWVCLQSSAFVANLFPHTLHL